MPTPEHEALADDLERAVHGQPWHGPSLETLLADVDARAAAAHPVAGAHSIWELVLHMAAWTGEVARRLGGATPGEPEPGDWPPVPTRADASAWGAARTTLFDAHARALAALAACPATRLAQRVGSADSPELGTGQTYAAMVRGLAQHHAYHGGQLAVIKRALTSQVMDPAS